MTIINLVDIYRADKDELCILIQHAKTQKEKDDLFQVLIDVVAEAREIGITYEDIAKHGLIN